MSTTVQINVSYGIIFQEWVIKNKRKLLLGFSLELFTHMLIQSIKPATSIYVFRYNIYVYRHKYLIISINTN